MNKLTGFLAVGFMAVSASLSVGAGASVTVTISCGAVGQELTMCREGAEAWAAKTGNRVNVLPTPNSATERLALYQQILSAESPDIDVYQIDVIWPGMLGRHFIDLAPIAGDVVDEHFPAIIANNTVGDRLIAMPWFIDAGLLYYRKDLLAQYRESVPTTWRELAATAGRVQAAEREAGNDRMWGYVFQGRSYEGLTCNALEWIASHGGGSIVESDGRISVDGAGAVAALTEAAGWVNSISPPGVLNYGEEEARGVFQSGNAVFMRNWPYAWSLSQADESPVRGRVGVTRLPTGDRRAQPAATLGGWQLAVSRYSRHPGAAVDLVLYLTSHAEQKRRAIKGSYNPTIEALYLDGDVLAAAPFFGELRDTFLTAVPRPSTVTGSSYNRVSTLVFSAVHDVLRGAAEAKARLVRLRDELERVRRDGEWRVAAAAR